MYPANYHEVQGNLITCARQYVCQQTNCVTRGKNKGLGIYKDFVDRYPQADIYAFEDAIARSIPGTIRIQRINPTSDTNGFNLVHMFSQYWPGKPMGYECGIYYERETSDLRVKWFRRCLREISSITGIREVAFPKGIGCGLAKGEWRVYETLLKEFSQDNPHIQVFVYKLDTAIPPRC